MQSNQHQKISVSLPPELIKYADQYEQIHGLKSRSDVLAKALWALREQELIESYRQATKDHLENPDPFLEVGVNDGLEPSTEDTW
jgi:metal-responsive CopG/Arc/MetJ family transcriptional regulator